MNVTSDKPERRDKLAIVAEMLEIAKGGAVKTQIMYRANLSFNQLNDYLLFLESNGMVELSEADGKSIYIITSKGLDFLQKHSELAKMLNEDGKIQPKTQNP